MKGRILKLTIFIFLSFLTLNSFSQTLNEIDYTSFSYYQIDSVNYKMTGVLNTGETVIIGLTESFYIDNAKILISKELGIVNENKEKLVSLVLGLHRLILGQKLNDNFKNQYSEFEYFDTEISRYEVSAIDNYGLILQEINIGTLVLVIYREWTQ